MPVRKSDRQIDDLRSHRTNSENYSGLIDRRSGQQDRAVTLTPLASLPIPSYIPSVSRAANSLSSHPQDTNVQSSMHNDSIFQRYAEVVELADTPS